MKVLVPLHADEDQLSNLRLQVNRDTHRRTVGYNAERVLH